MDILSVFLDWIAGLVNPDCNPKLDLIVIDNPIPILK